ncbi:uncharacterized protein LOC116415441, partial [Apis florea]|uniref:uncharacterized protein LOC116415441 n=1 Tax=Apis florea TaxID=7463 RepID=UPI0012FEE35D
MSMGVLALMASSSVAKALTDSFNLNLPKTGQIPTVGVQFTAQGLICAFLVAFIVPNIYYQCFKHNITIKLPDAVPQNIAGAFKNIIPFAINGYFGLAIVYGAMAFFWFIGIQGPSIVEPAVTAIYLSNVELNLSAWKAGNIAGANRILAQGTQYFVATLGGTGATLVITLMFAFWSKSKELKAVGRAASVPIFVDLFHMPGFIYNLPWTTPGTLGLIMGTGFSVAYDTQKCAEEAKSAGKLNVKNEDSHSVQSSNEDTSSKEDASKIPLLQLRWQGAKCLSFMCRWRNKWYLAKALNKLATENKLPLSVAAASFGAHHDLLA